MAPAVLRHGWLVAVFAFWLQPVTVCLFNNLLIPLRTLVNPLAQHGQGDEGDGQEGHEEVHEEEGRGTSGCRPCAKEEGVAAVFVFLFFYFELVYIIFTREHDIRFPC